MLNINTNYLNLKDNYLFAKISAEKNKFIAENKDNKLIDLSIGDVTLPLVPSALDGIKKAQEILSKAETFEGYPPSCGHEFLKKEILKNDYNKISELTCDEIFISDSSKGDVSNILDIFSSALNVAIQDPVYPVYVDSNIIRGNSILYYETLDTLCEDIAKDNLLVDIVYICSPNNPTGKIESLDSLQKIVNLAIDKNFLIFFDAAYEAFITTDNAIHSIYEIRGANKVAIEFKSYSKTAGFTPLRLSYTVIPNEIIINDKSINSLFKRFKNTKYNGPSFLSEYAMYNIYSSKSFNELNKNINYYLENTKLLSEYFTYRGMIPENSTVNSPYVWIKTPNNIDSWEYFYYLLNNYQIIGTPGSGFGKNGKGFFRFTGFGTRENTLEAIKRLSKS